MQICLPTNYRALLCIERTKLKKPFDKLSIQVKLFMVDSHLGETGVHVIVITALEQERETELDLVLTQHLLVMGGKHKLKK